MREGNYDQNTLSKNYFQLKYICCMTFSKDEILKRKSVE